ncbi:hypothetical protein FRUB_05183 [Fimbriiglobus ruber]|uniref:Uncharacterized protein n=1 Tax=Fimbriiglobus ruber TaxID=1908690 RepID=A0A225DKT1_9BACT|nr:hypothetical protein FRUB_05183 [Fimbriiglobus ruber]
MIFVKSAEEICPETESLPTRSHQVVRSSSHQVGKPEPVH